MTTLIASVKMDLLAAVQNDLAQFDWFEVRSEVDGMVGRFRMLMDALIVEGERPTAAFDEQQRIADYLGCVLATPKLLDLRHQQAPIKIDPQCHNYGDKREMFSPEAARDHSVRIDRAINGRAGAVSPLGKPAVVGHGMRSGMGMLAGWQVPNATFNAKLGYRTWKGIQVYPSTIEGLEVIQLPNGRSHGLGYCDYSGVASSLVWGSALVNDRIVETADVYTTAPYHKLITNAALPLPMARYPGVGLPAELVVSPPFEPSNLGEAALYYAQQDLAAGVRELYGANDGPEIRKYLDRFGLKAPKHWCAAALSSWLFRGAIAMNVDAPILGSPGARACEGQFIRAKLWVPKSRLDDRALVPGNVPVWWRGAEPSWPGHIGIIESHKNGSKWFQCIEGNSGDRGDRVARMPESTDDPQLLGVGVLANTSAPYQPTQHELLEAARLIQLGCDVMRG
jgi:hypothetical protein